MCCGRPVAGPALDAAIPHDVVSVYFVRLSYRSFLFMCFTSGYNNYTLIMLQSSEEESHLQYRLDLRFLQYCRKTSTITFSEFWYGLGTEISVLVTSLVLTCTYEKQVIWRNKIMVCFYKYLVNNKFYFLHHAIFLSKTGILKS